MSRHFIAACRGSYILQLCVVGVVRRRKTWLPSCSRGLSNGGKGGSPVCANPLPPTFLCVLSHLAPAVFCQPVRRQQLREPRSLFEARNWNSLKLQPRNSVFSAHTLLLRQFLSWRPLSRISPTPPLMFSAPDLLLESCFKSKVSRPTCAKRLPYSWIKRQH